MHSIGFVVDLGIVVALLVCLGVVVTFLVLVARPRGARKTNAGKSVRAGSTASYRSDWSAHNHADSNWGTHSHTDSGWGGGGDSGCSDSGGGGGDSGGGGCD